MASDDVNEYTSTFGNENEYADSLNDEYDEIDNFAQIILDLYKIESVRCLLDPRGVTEVAFDTEIRRAYRVSEGKLVDFIGELVDGLFYIDADINSLNEESFSAVGGYEIVPPDELLFDNGWVKLNRSPKSLERYYKLKYVNEVSNLLALISSSAIICGIDNKLTIDKVLSYHEMGYDVHLYNESGVRRSLMGLDEFETSVSSGTYLYNSTSHDSSHKEYYDIGVKSFLYDVKNNPDVTLDDDCIVTVIPLNGVARRDEHPVPNHTITELTSPINAIINIQYTEITKRDDRRKHFAVPDVRHEIRKFKINGGIMQALQQYLFICHDISTTVFQDLVDTSRESLNIKEMRNWTDYHPI